ncbi:MAG: ATP-binding protein [Phycisphaerae bacterium]
MPSRTVVQRAVSVLIVEDNESQRRTLTTIMQNEGFEVTGCSTAAALEHLEREDFGVAVVDLRLPDLSGTQLLERLRALNERIPVIINTAYGSFDSAREAVNLGAFAYVEKAGDPRELVRQVHRASRLQFDRYAGDLETAVAARTRELRTANQMLRHEITERQRAEEALRESEQKYRQLFATVPDAVLVFDADTRRFVDVNESAVRLYGYTREEFLKLSHGEITAEPDESEQSIREMLSGQRHSIPLCYHRRKDGTVFPVEISAGTFVLGDQEVVCGVVREITERKRADEEKAGLEAQLRQAQKMEAIGQLAGGVAHDFNNILTAILGNVELLLAELKSELPADDSLVMGLVQIDRAGQRATSLTRQLLAFSHHQAIAPEVLDPNRILTDLEEMLRHLLDERITLELRQETGVGRIRADAGQLQQVIMNLVVNARDAMPDGGTITIETASVFLDEEYAKRHAGAHPGAHVLITVSDTGQGMDAQTRERVFEPFFTTKPVGRGTGLGLSTVYGIVKQVNGHIALHSEPGRGTIFKIYLPAVEAPALQALDR